MVRFLNYRELRNTPSAVWNSLDAGDTVAIVSNGEPRAIMLGIENGDLDGTLQMIHRVRAQMALAQLRADAARRGLDALSDADIDVEVAAARAARRPAAG